MRLFHKTRGVVLEGRGLNDRPAGLERDDFGERAVLDRLPARPGPEHEPPAVVDPFEQRLELGDADGGRARIGPIPDDDVDRLETPPAVGQIPGIHRADAHRTVRARVRGEIRV